MNARIWGIIGGVALVLALLSPLVLGSAQKVERLFETAEALYERSDYEGAIVKYKEALKESKKFGAETERIDKDFTTLVNLKIAQCHYELAENSSDIIHYQSALRHIEEVVLETQVVKHQEELTYLWAETLYKTGKLDQAKSKFSRLIEKFPNSQWEAEALYTVGDINAQQENYDEALKTFQKLVIEFPHSEFKQKAELRLTELSRPRDEPDPPEPDPIIQCETMFKYAIDLQQQGRIHDAYQRYTDLITQCPDSKYVTDAYVAKAEIHLEAKDYVNTRANYEEAMYSTNDQERKIEIYKKYQLTYLVPVYVDEGGNGKNGDNVSRFIEATRLRKEGKFLEAAKLYEILAESDLPAEDTIKSLYWTGFCYHKAALTNPNLFNKSVNAFKKLIGNYSNETYTTEAYYHLASVYTDWAQKSGNKSKWQLVINTVEEVDTEHINSDDVKNRGWLSRMLELKEKAIRKLEPPPPPPPPPPRDPGLLVDQGYIHLGSGELEKALKKARQALDIDSDYQRAHQLSSAIKETYYGRGWTFFDEEQYDKAIAAFKNAINIDPKFKESHCHLGVIYIQQERYTEAVKALEKAAEIDSGFKEAHFNLALAYLKLDEFEFARNAATTALEIDPTYEPANMLIRFIAD